MISLEKEFGKNIKARKEHICSHCRNKIYKNEIYHHNKYFDVRTRIAEMCRLHLQCVDTYYHQCAELITYTRHWEQWYEEIFI